ncbi:MAG TPA: hypothetical protein VK661_02185, partial [Planctomycetota bacterium]|nr:hypothetical protein [Planctomycetota bacterium]
WAARLLEYTRRFSSPRPHLPETRQLFARARELKPESWPALEGMIRVAIHDIDLAEAATLCREALARLPASSAGASWTLPHLRTVLAYVLMESGDREGAARELESIDLARNEIEPWDAWKGSELWEALGREDRVLACLERLVEDGFRPGPRLAAVYEKAGRWEDALRAIDRAAPGNYDETFLLRDPDRIFVVNARAAAPGPTPVDLAKLREGLLERGGDAMIRNFLARLREAMNADEERRARAAFEKLGDDAIAERDNGTEELRRLGPKCAPVVKAGLESRDPEIRRRSRALLLTWATSR